MIELSPPPRVVPLTLTARCLFSGLRYQVSWLMLAFATTFLFGFAFDSSSFLLDRGKAETTIGTLTGKKRTIFSTGVVYSGGGVHGRGERIYKYSYTYIVMDKLYNASSVSTDRAVDKEDPVVVEYLGKYPSVSRIQGMPAELRLSGGVTPVVLVLVIILIAFSTVWSMTRKRVGLYQLLKGGKTAIGTVRSVNLLSRSSGTEWYEAVYEFVADGCLHQVKDRPYYTDRVEIGERRTLLYDQDDPHKAALLDNIPCSIVLDRSGQIMPDSPRSAAAVLLIPIASAALMSISIYLEFFK